MWFYTTNGVCLNLALMTSVSFVVPGQIHYKIVGRTDTQTAQVDEAEHERVARYIAASGLTKTETAA